jgi:regulator of protease activity HflC (stomatin/prohibitin superfamily)
MRPEGEKAGVEIKEMRFGDPAVPPELLVARLRQQLSGQLKASYEQEMQAQQARVQTENSRATADQQPELVKADIELARAERLKKAAQLTGEGEEARLSAIAEGQKAQTAVLGAERVVELRKYELMVNKVIDLADKHPEMIEAALQNASKLVPNTVISTGSSGGIDGAAGILGSLLGSSRASEDHHASSTK